MGAQSGVGEQPHLVDIKEALSENKVPSMFRIFTPISVEGTEMAVKTDSEAMEVSCQCVSAAGGTCQLNKETGCRHCRARDLCPKPPCLGFLTCTDDLPS